MQTILGAGGAIGSLLAKELKQYTTAIRLVGRHPQRVNDSDELVAADLLNRDQVLHAVQGSEIVYLTVGLPYNTQVWAQQWPVIMENVIHACLHQTARLVFFDNIYLYEGNDLSDIRETNTTNPPSRKGQVRKAVVDQLWHAVQQKGLKALIARSADFYGPNIKGASMLTETVIKPLQKNKSANWMIGTGFRHSFTFTPDAARATAQLGNTPDAYGESWHLPTSPMPPTGKEWIEMVARALNVKSKHRIVGRSMVKVLGLVVPILRESYEMLYQFDKDYVFNSAKFEKRFGWRATPYEEGIKQVIAAL